MGRKKGQHYHDSAVDTQILIDCASDIEEGQEKPRFYKIGKRYGVHHMYVCRLWESQTADKKKEYHRDAADIIDIAKERIIAKNADVIDEVNNQMMRCATKALDIWEQRLTNEPYKIADRDLISFISKASKPDIPEAKEPTATTKNGNIIFNIMDQSITTYNNEE